jgi:hypothetical protein
VQPIVRTLTVGLCAGVLAVDLPAASAASADRGATPAPEPAIRSGNHLQVRHSGKCADVERSSGANGAPIHQWGCLDKDSQRWDLDEVENGYFNVRNVNSGKCMEVYDANPNDGARVVQWRCYPSSDPQRHQQWRLADRSGGYYELRARHSNKCLEVPNGSHEDSVDLVQATCDENRDHQAWRLTP